MIRRVAFASAIGTALEWYDFLLYGTASAIVFGRVFFPGSDPATGTLESLATFAVGFFARPFGGLLFSHIGDKHGRRIVLMLTLIVMGAASTLVGLIPSFDAIGVLAPILLVALRILQGLGAGAEYAGGSLMAAEHAPRKRRGFFSAIPQAGNAVGAILGSLVFTPFTLLPEESFLAWGWRVPFLLSIVIVPIGLYIRFRVNESPAFTVHVETKKERTRAPILTVLRTAPRAVVLGLLVSIGPNVATYVPSVYILSYITDNLGLAASIATGALIIANAIKLVTLPLSGYLSDLFGRRNVFCAGALLTMLAAFPMFWLLDTKNVLAVWFAVVLVLTFGLDLMLGSQGAMLAEMFDTNVRYTGMAFCREIAAAAVGGTLPFVAAWLNGLTSGTWTISVLMIVLCLVAGAGACGTKDRRDMPFVEPAEADAVR